MLKIRQRTLTRFIMAVILIFSSMIIIEENKVEAKETGGIISIVKEGILDEKVKDIVGEIKKADILEQKLIEVDNLVSNLKKLNVKEANKKSKEAKKILQEMNPQIQDCTFNESELKKAYDKVQSKLDEYETMLRSLRKKINEVKATTTADMSKPIGFTTQELRYILQNSGLIEEEEVIETLSEVITSEVKRYPVNELLVISVMSLESQYFTSSMARNHNNFSGMLKKGGKPLHFSSMREGMKRGVKCLYKNLKGKNTIYDINKTYCEPVEGEKYGWSKLVLKIMKRYKSIDII